MPPRKPSRVSELPKVAIASEVVTEDLPAPLVYYPNHYGTFFAFAESREETPALCACAEPAVRNLLRLLDGERESNINSLRTAPLGSWYFPDAISRASIGHAEGPLGAVHFRPGLCHRCNLKTPTLRYCHEMYGQRFVQHYGWYINQAFLRVGIRPMAFEYLPDICPAEFLPQVREIRAFRDRLLAGDRWTDEEYKRISKLEREVANGVQNIARAEFGFRGVGEGWVSETLLYQIVCRLFPGEQVLRHHRPDWLDGLELDVYVPGRRIGVEYQGQQHFHPIEAWGGQSALLQLRERDARKARMCREVGVTLVTVDYTEPLTDDHIRARFTGLRVLI